MSELMDKIRGATVAGSAIERGARAAERIQQAKEQAQPAEVKPEPQDISPVGIEPEESFGS